MRQCYAFVGPTYPGLQYPGLQILPPAKRGDILELIDKSPAGILVVDGFFGQQASVMHRELLEALRMGIRVVGCSSMGALRAADLHEYGMIGVGKIFESFRSGRVTGDDEVAMLHGPPELQYCEVTFPLCNLRSTVEVVSQLYNDLQEAFSNALAVSMQLPYSERTFSQVGLLLQSVGAGNNHLRVIDLLRRHWVDQKRLDLEAALPKLFDDSVPDNAIPLRTGWSETSWLRLRKQSSQIGPLEESTPLVEAIVRFYDPSFEDHLLGAFTAAILSRLPDAKADLEATGTCASSTRLREYLRAWPAAEVDGAVGAAIYLHPASTLEDWMQSPPRAVSKRALLDWARREFSVVDCAYRSYKLSPNYHSVLTCAHIIEQFIKDMSVRRSAWTSRELWNGLEGNRRWLTSPTAAAREFFFEDSDEMLTHYQQLASFEAALLDHGHNPWWGVDKRNMNCISDLVYTLGATENE